MYLRDLLDYFKSDRKVDIISRERIMFYYSLSDFFKTDIPCIKQLLSCKVRYIDIDEQGTLKIYLFGYGERS